MDGMLLSYERPPGYGKLKVLYWTLYYIAITLECIVKTCYTGYDKKDISAFQAKKCLVLVCLQWRMLLHKLSMSRSP